MDKSKLKRKFDQINSGNEISANEKKRKTNPKPEDNREISFIKPSTPYLPK